MALVAYEHLKTTVVQSFFSLHVCFILFYFKKVKEKKKKQTDY